MVLINEDAKPQLLGGVGEKLSNNGSQWYHRFTDNGSRDLESLVVSRNGIFPTLTTRLDVLGVVVMEDKTLVADGKTMNFKYSDYCGTLLTNSNFTGCGVQLIGQKMKYELSNSMKKHINSSNEKWTGNNDKCLINRDIAVRINTRVGNTRCDCSDYIEMDGKMGENENLKNVDLTQYRIRKLTPRECFRLMGVKDEDFDNVAVNQSDSSLYHLAGDSIVVDVLENIFKQML